MKQRAFDVLGNIAIVKFSDDARFKEKKKFAQKILKENKAIKTILEKTGKVKGRLRKIHTRYLAGERTKEVLYKESKCLFRFNVDTTYFSPRLSNERKEIASKIKPGEKVFVMFAGVAPFSIVIAKNSKAEKVFSNEINREANKYGKLNIELNNLKSKIEMLDGDVKKIVEKLCNKNLRYLSEAVEKYHPSEIRGRSARKIRGCPRFDVIVMPRPNLKETFLKQAFALSKKGTRIYYYGFCKCDSESQEKLIEEIKEEAKKFKKKIKILKIKIAGAVAPFKIRLRVDFVVEKN